MLLRAWILVVLTSLTPLARGQAVDDRTQQERIKSRLQVLSRIGSYAQVAELYIELANLDAPQAAANNLVNAGRNFMYAYRYKRRDPRYLAQARLPLGRALEVVAALPAQQQQSARYSVRSAYDVLADIELSVGNPAGMLAAMEQYLLTPGLSDSFQRHGRVRAGVARILLGDQAAPAELARELEQETNQRYQLQTVARELTRQADVLARGAGAARLAEERRLRRQAAQLVILWERGYERRNFNLWNYRWATEALVSGGEPREAIRLANEMSARFAKKPLTGSVSNYWQNQRIDETKLQHARALLAIGKARQAWSRLSALRDQVYLIAPSGKIVGRGVWIGRARRPDGRGETLVRMAGRVVRFVDLQVFPGGMVRCVSSDLFGRHSRAEVRVIERPFAQRFELIDGQATAAQELWRATGSFSFLLGEVLPALERLRATLRKLRPSAYRALAGKAPGAVGELAVRGWRAELDLAWALIAAGQVERVSGELHALSLAAPPTAALRQELEQLLLRAAALREAAALSSGAGLAAPPPE